MKLNKEASLKNEGKYCENYEGRAGVEKMNIRRKLGKRTKGRQKEISTWKQRWAIKKDM